MARTKGSKNKNPPITPASLSLTLEERIQLISNLIVDTISAKQQAEAVVAKEFING
jgi:hypothetical protein